MIIVVVDQVGYYYYEMAVIKVIDIMMIMMMVFVELMARICIIVSVANYYDWYFPTLLHLRCYYYDFPPPIISDKDSPA